MRAEVECLCWPVEDLWIYAWVPNLECPEHFLAESLETL